MKRRLAFMGALALLVALLAESPARSIAAAAADTAPTFANLKGEVVLENARVLVQKFVIQPGQSTGLHTHPSNQLLVFINGGVLRSDSGRSTLWKDGRVLWQNAADRADAGSTNTGSTPIELICVSLKPVASPTPAVGGKPK
jgi:beta-alanine degradation protein BauB